MVENLMVSLNEIGRSSNLDEARNFDNLKAWWKIEKKFRTGIIPTNSFFIEIIQSSKK